MIDVFYRTMRKQDPVRAAMSRLALARWGWERICKIKRVTNLGIREGRQFAEDNALSDPYIFTDDDCVIMGTDWVRRAVGIMLRHPEYAIVSTLSMIEGENQARPDSVCFARPDDESCEIYPMHAVGQPMLIRKGILIDLPAMDLGQECGILHQYVLDRGYKMGLLWSPHPNPLRHMHLGNGFSSNPLLRWAY